MVTVGVRVTEEERAQLEQIAQANDVSISWVVRKAIREFLAKLNQNQ